ncbi:DUF3761 domain-containing protein [Granulicella arctica]|uniref:DUF3761 domain-containing protein n=1 Tax=Granulicella arctica TaxID=940613 RepID=A0A7Y9PHQ4_9BACT|nr:DUF3761 domain-containing protein [Granulicella arctica]NYF80105.1 hypothetical protein [Granulicella arctica]
MKPALHLATLAAGLLASLLVACPLLAQTTAPATPPPGATGLCKDGTYALDAKKSKACHGHHGIKQWYPAPIPSAAPAPEAPTATPPAVASAPSPTTQARTQSQAAAQSAGQSVTPPPTQSIKKDPTDPADSPTLASGPGFVWVNPSKKVYYCYGTRYYGKTRHGVYMTEAEARAQGIRGKSCPR